MKVTLFRILDAVVVGGMCVLLVVIVVMIAVLYVKEIAKRKGRRK